MLWRSGQIALFNFNNSFLIVVCLYAINAPVRKISQWRNYYYLFFLSPLAWDDWSFGRLAWEQGPTRRGLFGSLADDACERTQLENHSWIRELWKIDGSVRLKKRGIIIIVIIILLSEVSLCNFWLLSPLLRHSQSFRMVRLD